MPTSWKNAMPRSKNASPNFSVRRSGNKLSRGKLRVSTNLYDFFRKLSPPNVWIGAALLLVFLMLFPLGAIFRASLWDDTGFTLSRYLEVFTNEQFLKAIWNTLIISTWVGVIAVIIGALLAWLVTRTDLPWKKPIRALVMASFVTPPFLGAFAWTLLAGPNAGSLNKLYRAVTGSEEALFNIFTMPGLIFVMALYSFPFVFSMIANVCELISSDLEDAAEILGANKWRTAWTVTLPLAMPALIGGFILAFLHSLLLKAALSKAWALPLTWDNFTLHNLSFTFFEYGDTQLAIYNTFKLGLITATFGTLLATLIAYITNRNLFRGARYLSFFALAPLVIPGIVLAVGLFIAYTRPPLVLYGTVWILFVAYLTKEMPSGFSQAESTFKSIHPELEDASRIIGANRLISLKDVTAPLARSGLIAAWCFIFISVIRELSASILLFSPRSKVVSVVIFDLKEEGQVGVIAVLGILLLVVCFAVISTVQWIAGRDVMGTRE